MSNAFRLNVPPHRLYFFGYFAPNYIDAPPMSFRSFDHAAIIRTACRRINLFHRLKSVANARNREYRVLFSRNDRKFARSSLAPTVLCARRNKPHKNIHLLLLCFLPLVLPSFVALNCSFPKRLRLGRASLRLLYLCRDRSRAQVLHTNDIR